MDEGIESGRQLGAVCDEKVHDFVKFSYTSEGYFFACTKCKELRRIKTEDFQEEEFPIRHVFQQSQDDCGIAIIAMLLDLEYGDAFELCRDYLDDGDLTIRKSDMMQAFLESKGIKTALFTWKEAVFPTTLTELWEPDEILLVVTVPNERDPGHYVLFHDGLIYCPSLGIVGEKIYFERFPDRIGEIISVRK